MIVKQQWEKGKGRESEEDKKQKDRNGERKREDRERGRREINERESKKQREREREDSLIVVNPLYLIHSFPAPNLALLSFASSRSRKKKFKSGKSNFNGNKIYQVKRLTSSNRLIWDRNWIRSNVTFVIVWTLKSTELCINNFIKEELNYGLLT